MMGEPRALTGFVAIGRNEGERLKRCLASLPRERAPVVYVDSGSRDDSVAAAKALGAEVVALKTDAPFTAARARNAGFERLIALWPDTDYVMFIDGDCALEAGWVAVGARALEADPGLAAVCGRLRERDRDKSLYNRLCDAEWARPVGETDACGGNAIFRVGALRETGGYRDALVAGEEPELCLRLRERGWRILRLDADMALHDAGMIRFSQWWKRSVRAGRAFAEVSHLHRASPQRIWARETARAVGWSFFAACAALAGVFVHKAAFLALLLLPVQIIRVAIKERRRVGRDALALGFFTMLAKFAETQGILEYWLSRLRGRPALTKEYKTARQ